MDYEFRQSPVSKAILTSVFVGFFATIACLIYNIIFRESTCYKPADVINVSSLIFGVNLIFFAIGLIYFFLRSTFKRGDLFFEIAFAVIILLCVWRAAYLHMQNNGTLTSEFRTLMIGVILIMGIGVELIPLLYRNRKFVDAVL